MAGRQASKARSAAAPVTVTRRELLVGDSDDTFRHFIHGLLAFSERVMAIREGFGALIGLTGIQYTVLISIAHLQGTGQVGVGTIASHLHLSGAFITTVTNQLERLGLIRKLRDPEDRRKAVLVTSRRAHELLEKLAPMQQKVNDQLFEPLSRAQFTELARQMDALVRAGDQAVALLKFLRAGSP